MNDLSIDGAIVVSPDGTHDQSVSIAGGRIVDIGPGPARARTHVDAHGLILLPGFVDTHVHLMAPAQPWRETWVHGSAAAAVSGVTTIIEHTHAGPVRTSLDLQDKIASVGEVAGIDYSIAGHAWHDDLSSIPALWAAGVAYFKVFTCTTHGIPAFPPEQLERLFLMTGRLGAPCLVHCEDEELTNAAEIALRQAGRADPEVILRWRTRKAERTAIKMVLALAKKTSAAVAIAHVSDPVAAGLVAAETAIGAGAVAETCPQYLVLKEEEILKEGPLRKFTPPARARSEADLEAMWALVRSGAIHHISSDHAPSTIEQKTAGTIWDAPFGLPGLDTTSSILIDAAIRGVIPFSTIARAYAAAPSRLYGMQQKGAIRVGNDADLVLVDPTQTRTLMNKDVLSKAGWTPYAGRRVKGAIVATFLRGVEIALNGKPLVRPGFGRFIPGPGRSGTGSAFAV
jgi:dihydroorotase (multifunctional complex type)